MEIDKKEQLRLMLADFAGEGLLPLDEAAKLLKVSEPYLLGLVRRGKVKAFKVDEHWFIRLDWLEQFRQQIREHISETSALIDSPRSGKKWVRPIKKRRRRFFNLLIISYQVAIASFTLAIMVLASAWMAPAPGKIVAGGDYLLSGVLSVSGVYARSAVALSRVVSSEDKINDEELTRWSRSILGRDGSDTGQVAGASEELAR